MSESISIRDHRDLVNRIAEEYGIRDTPILLVPSVSDWCRARGINQQSPFRTATSFHRDHDDLIVMMETIRADLVDGVYSNIRMHLPPECLAEIRIPQRFIAHLVLHEFKHLRDAGASEKECDVWALEELRKLGLP